ncbi:hypothetical protein A0H81_12670 [Grifola frondosa]|uniref:Uncharacterized protein n=1 Tax=Grifola frondosa TaxID=5627 RepID=A0A1C7LTG3_GRIFR|nr:hypothetical protein A0H81_12670 [Grifola frondosa]
MYSEDRESLSNGEYVLSPRTSDAFGPYVPANHVRKAISTVGVWSGEDVVFPAKQNSLVLWQLCREWKS